jgi:hypothetical protein
MASFDPVALDKACADMVNAQQGNPDSMLDKAYLAPGKDKFKGVYSDIPWEVQLEYGEALGIGTQNYKIVEV